MHVGKVKVGAFRAGFAAMIAPLEGSQVAAPLLLWSVEGSPEPKAAWCQGWFGELFRRSKDGAFNRLRHVPRPMT